jgi:hypothetical protein
MTTIKQLAAMKKARNAKRRYAEMYISQKATDPAYQEYLRKKSLRKARAKKGWMTEEQKAAALARLRAAMAKRNEDETGQ